MSTSHTSADRASGKATPGCRSEGRRRRCARPPVHSLRRFAPLCLLLPFVLGGTGAFAQRLLSVVPLGDDPTLDGWSVEVDYDVVRSAPQRLEFEAPDGRVLAPEMRVFEDRGDGNAMWVGGYPELGYDNVVLTLQDGHLVGRFGVPEGGTFWIRSGEDGAGRLTEGRPTGANCGGGIVPEGELAIPVREAARTDPPRRVEGKSNHDRLDILILHTEAARQRLEVAGWGPPATFTKHAMDYLNLVLRNNQVALTANLVHQEAAPAALEGNSDPLPSLATNRNVQDLRAEHNADLVHLFFGVVGVSPNGTFCGQAYTPGRGSTAEGFWPGAYGVTTVAGGCVSAARLVRDGEHSNHVETFAHEVGHNLGAHHDPDNARTDPANAIYPYAFGHHNFTPIPNRKSVMSYNEGRQLPWFSTVRLKPGGYTLGVAGQRENERVVQQTIHMAAQFSDHLPEPGAPDPGEPPPPPPPPPRPAAPTDLTVIETSRTSVKATWTDRSNNELRFEVHARLEGGDWRTVARVPANTESADISGLQSGGSYDFRVRAVNRSGGRVSGVTTIVLSAVEYTDCVPTAAQITFEAGYTASMCIEYERDGETVTSDAQDFGLDSEESGLLYFFERDNAEVLVKVLSSACSLAGNDHVWVFVAPVTTLAFNLRVDEVGSERSWTHSNPKGGQTATTKSDIQAFPCPEPSGSAVASRGDVGGDLGVDLVDAGFPRSSVTVAAKPVGRKTGAVGRDRTPDRLPVEPPVAVAQPVGAGGEAECEPEPVVTLGGGYTVNMCVENVENGETVVHEVKDYGLDSDQSAILYFFDRSNAEVLVKVLTSACGLAGNDHVWVFVAPVTTLAYNLTIESPDGETLPWKRSNSLNRTAPAESDLKAFPCSN